MKRCFRYLVFFFPCLLGGNMLYLQGQDTIENPEWSVSEARAFDTIALDAYRSDPVFQYGAVRQFNESLWSRIKRWFWNKMDQLFGTEGNITGMIIFFSFLAIGVIALLYYLTRIQKSSPFRKGDRKTGQEAELFDENLKPADLKAKILQAKAKSDYRSAVRYLTIRMFKELEQAGALEMDPSTSIDQYRKKMGQNRISSQFNALTRYFEFVWYGEYALSSADFARIEMRFEEFADTLKEPN